MDKLLPFIILERGAKTVVHRGYHAALLHIPPEASEKTVRQGNTNFFYVFRLYKNQLTYFEAIQGALNINVLFCRVAHQHFQHLSDTNSHIKYRSGIRNQQALNKASNQLFYYIFYIAK